MTDRLTRAVFEDATATAWNREVFYADTATPAEIVSAGLALPLFGTSRLVLVRGLAGTSAKAIAELRDALAEARRHSGGWPSEGTTVVLVVAGGDRRAPALGLVPEGEQVEVRGPTGYAVVGWLRERARGAGLELTAEAAQALVTLIGEDLSRLAGELDKAALFVGEDRRVTEEVVRALAGESRMRQYWELSQALEGGDQAGGLRILEQLLAAGEDPLALLAQVVGHVRDVWRVQAGLATGRDVRDIARFLPRRRPDKAVERLMARAAAFSGGTLATAVRSCFEVEQRLKSGAASPAALLTALVAELARPGRS